MSVWILLRGLSRDHRHWGDFAPAFAAALPDARVITLDLPGNGERHRETSPAAVGAMVEDCRRMLQSRGIDQAVNVLAMSLGAMLALDWASRYPNEIRRCVLINTSLRGVSPFYQRLRPANYGRLLSMAISGSAANWEQAVLAMTSRRQDRHLAQRWTEYHRQNPVSKANAWRQLVAAARFGAPASCPPTELLLLASTYDRLVNVVCSRALAARWRIPLVEHPSAGHDLPLDEARWVIDQVRGWLAVDPPGRATIRRPAG